MSDNPKYPESTDVTNWDQFTQKNPEPPKDNVILEQKYRGSDFTVSEVNPDNPTIVSGTATTVGSGPNYQDTGKKLADIKISSDNFMLGASAGGQLFRDVFENEQSDLNVISEAILNASKGIREKVGLGMQKKALRVKAIQNLERFTDSGGVVKSERYNKEKLTFMKQVLSKMPENTTQEQFDQMVQKLVIARQIMNVKVSLHNSGDISNMGYQDGFKRAFNGLAETYRSQPDYEEKYWYLK